jgi:hypothetical protein
MSTNAIVALLYVELGLFIFGIVWPIAAKLLENARASREPVPGSEHRDLAVSRLNT